MIKKGILILVIVSLALITYAADNDANISGRVMSKESKEPLAYVSISLLNQSKDKTLKGTITQEDGFFVLKDIAKGQYVIKFSMLGFEDYFFDITIGGLNQYYDLGTVFLEQATSTLEGIQITATVPALDKTMNKMTYTMENMTSHGGGSILEVLTGLPGITTTKEGQIELRGSDKVAVLLDGQQSALTGFGSQSGLDNLPASAIEKIEIIHNPSARYDANGQAGIVNVILKKQHQRGFNGQVSMTTGIGSVWEKVDNMPTIDPQYRLTPKLNPSLSLNYRGARTNVFLQSDFLWHKRVNKNEFFDRNYTDLSVLKQQYLENRVQNIPTGRLGVDWFVNESNKVTFAANFSRKAYVDRGSLPFFTEDYSERKRLWLFLEDEVETALGMTGNYSHSFKQPGHKLEAHASYTHLKKEEYYNMENITPDFTGTDAFDLMADQQISDFNVDYTKPLSRGRIEAGSKFRWRYLPIDIQYYPGEQTLIDVSAGGWANYSEIIPALYTNYFYEHRQLEAEIGLRAEYVTIDYEVTPHHNTYSSDGYTYFKLFPNLRLGYNLDDAHKVSLFYNKRVDRPEEKALRVFPKYDDPEILKVGNPSLNPQYTESVELGFRKTWQKNDLYLATYYRYTRDFISNIYTSSPTTGIIYTTPQNTGSGTNTGIEVVYNQVISSRVSVNFSLNGYYNGLSAFQVENNYPYPIVFQSDRKDNYAGNAKVSTNINFPKNVRLQLFGTYLTKDIIPQGEVAARYSIDMGLKKAVQNGKGEVFVNGVDLFNTMQMKQKITSDQVTIVSTDYFETQVFRIGYSYKF